MSKNFDLKVRGVSIAFILAIVFSCWMGSSHSVFAQMESAAVSGRVTDQDGLVMPDVEVELRNTDTNVSQTTKTNGEGFYSFPSISPGNYVMSVRKQAFQTVSVTGITVHIQDSLSRNFVLQVGASAVSVTVTADQNNINTSDASVSTVVDQSYVKNMPLSGRSFQDLITLTPGVLTQTPQMNLTQGPSGAGAVGEFSVNGQRTESNYYMVDGVSANAGANGGQGFQSASGSGSVASSTALGTTQALVSVDELQEFRVQSSTYSSEYGRNPGAQISFQTKSGVNTWHGTASDYLRNDFFDANDWFNNYFGAKEPPLRQNDFGGTFGGPVRIPHAYNGKDKTFFFISYEGLRLLQPQAASIAPVPDQCLRGTVSACPSGGSLAPAPAVLQPVLNAWPVQSPKGVDDTSTGLAQFIGTWSNPSSLDSGSVRLDQVVGNRTKLFFRFNETSSDSSSRGTFAFSPSQEFVTSNTMRTYTAGATSSLTSRLNNDFRLNYTSNISHFDFGISPIGGSAPTDLVQLAGSGAGTGIAFTFSLGGRLLFLQQEPFSAAQRQWNLVDTVSYSLGRHQLKFGADYRRLMPFATEPTATFSYSYGDASKVQSNTADIFVFARNPAYPLYTNFSAFVQDEWKLTPRLNLSMGVRWEVNPPPGVTQGLNAYTIEGATPDTWNLAPQGTPLWKTTWYNFAPRLGAAYILRSAPGWETVVRAGGGLFFDSGQQLASFGFVNGPGFAAFGPNPSLSSGPFPGPIPSLVPKITQPPNPANSTPYGFYPHLQLPYTLEWNASVEQALGRFQALTFSYVGSHASRLLQQNQYLTPNNVNGIQQFFFVQNGLTSDYDSGQAEFRRNLSRGLTALGSYTFSHCIDYGSSNFLVAYSRGNCDFDVRHNLSGAFSYDVPNAGHGRILGAVLHHWGVDDRIMVRSSFPVTLFGNGFVNGPVFTGTNGREIDEGLDFATPAQPVYLYGANCASTLQSLGDLGPGQGCPGGRAINPSAFTPVPVDANGVPTRLGTAPRNFARGFGAWQMNLAVRREFPIYENLKLQFRAEAFNLFNHPNFGTVDANLSDSTFGQSTQTLASSLGSQSLSSLYQMGGPRSMQFALKLIF